MKTAWAGESNINSSIFLQIYIEHEVENHEKNAEHKIFSNIDKKHKFHILYIKNTMIFLLKVMPQGKQDLAPDIIKWNQQPQQQKCRSYTK